LFRTAKGNVGFFDSDHGQTGVAHLNGIELHPTLKIELL